MIDIRALLSGDHFRMAPGLKTLWAVAIVGITVQTAEAAPPGMNFKVHEIARPGGDKFGQTSAVDVDRDGDLDFISGRQGGDLFWFENDGDGPWRQHLIGRNAKTDVGGVAFDVDGDGWVDQVSGGTWFRNPGQPRDALQWQRSENGATSAHDNLAADIDGDGMLDLVSILDKAGVFWYRIPADPTQPWIEHKVLGVTDPQCHGGIAVGDIDGDGDADITRVDRWLENADGKGETWTERRSFDYGKVGPWGIQTRAALVDIDRDGDQDLVQAEGDVLDGRVAWFENRNGNGQNWQRHLIKPSGHGQDFHSLCVADFDNDGDADIFTGGGPLTKGEHQWFLWENADGRGGAWTEHVIRRGLRTHESVCGDVDGDGDIDILTKPWRGDLHLFVENLVNAPGEERKEQTGFRRPYPPSPVIERLEIDWSTHRRLAEGSDNWPTTWADDGHLYTAWGDGGGFGGSNSQGRVTLGVARIKGDAADYQGVNVWGGFRPEHPAAFGGKSYGIISVGGVLHMWVAPQPNPHLKECRLARSTDHGATWEQADWSFRFEDGLTIPTFLNFGRDNAGARDRFIYSYFIEPHWGPKTPEGGQYGFETHRPGRIHLARVPQNDLFRRDRYEFFAGIDTAGQPRWSANLADKQPVFRDDNGVGWNLSVSHNAGLNRYLLATEHTSTHEGTFGLFDAPEPWGPWTVVAYDEAWGEGHVEVSAFYWNFPTKWQSRDGRGVTLVFTGENSNDSWNTVAGTFVLKPASKR